MARRVAKTATERSRARRYRARLSRLTAAEKRWLEKYDKDVSTAAKARKVAPGKWGTEKLTRALGAELQRVLGAAGVDTAGPAVGQGRGAGYTATLVGTSLLAARAGDDLDTGPALDVDWSALGRGTRERARLASYFGIRARHVFNLTAELTFDRAGSTETAWLSIMSLTHIDNARTAISERLAELASVPSDVRITVSAWQVYVMRLPRARRPAGAKKP